ncbi:MAG TPA: transcriptional regulator [Spongiibacteraceae bacterium]|nr:transcriptional regulator [Spongiibacteraceae bacterium]HCS27921.1 transcriptional regulator [Spongiibacteraceae bacterium]|tara:strand:+ start:395 stop:874 length:480 start_codon:yes stop_codon:yes gene_type:complete
MLESGRVVAVDDDALWVETIRQSTCGSCSAQKGCGQGLLNKLGDGKRNHIRVLLGGAAPARFKIDDQVQFSVPDNVLLQAAALVYLLPLCSMLVGMGVAHEWFDSQKVAALGALAGFAIGFALVRLHAVINADNPKLQPRLVPAAENQGENTSSPVRLA